MGVICDENSDKNRGEKPTLNSCTKKKYNEQRHMNERDINVVSAAPMANKSNHNEYYIIVEFYVEENEKRKNIRIINSYESYKRGCNDFKFDECKRNEKDIKECKIEIEKKIISFSYFYSFNKSGTFQIKFLFNKIPKSFACLFYGCSYITKVDFSKFNTKNITDMSYMFSNCYSLTNVDFSNFNTQNVTDMSYMFCECGNLLSLDLSKFDTQSVTDMSSMFFKCTEIKNLDLSCFNTQNVTNMSHMFENCTSLFSLDLSNFNSKKANVSEMLNNLWVINLSNIICYDNKILKTYKRFKY